MSAQREARPNKAHQCQASSIQGQLAGVAWRGSASVAVTRGSPQGPQIGGTSLEDENPPLPLNLHQPHTEEEGIGGVLGGGGSEEAGGQHAGVPIH